MRAELVLAAESAPTIVVPDHFDAIRIMGLRIRGLDQAERGRVLFSIGEAPKGFGWSVAVKVDGMGESPSELDEHELGAKSDIGALEVAGHSLAMPRPKRHRPVELDPTDEKTTRMLARAEPRARRWQATRASAVDALAAIREAMAIELEDRVEIAVRWLRHNGRDFRVADGWFDAGPVTYDTTAEAADEPKSFLSSSACPSRSNTPSSWRR